MFQKPLLALHLVLLARDRQQQVAVGFPLHDGVQHDPLLGRLALGDEDCIPAGQLLCRVVQGQSLLGHPEALFGHHAFHAPPEGDFSIVEDDREGEVVGDERAGGVARDGLKPGRVAAVGPTDRFDVEVDPSGGLCSAG